MSYDRVARRAISRLREADLKVFEMIESCEDAGLVAVPELCEALRQSTITLVGFSCAFGDSGERGIAIAEHGFFEQKNRQRVENLVSNLQNAGKEVRLTIFIDDLEFRRVWGWSRYQKELTEECEFQIALAAEEGNIPSGAEVRVWSQVEPEATQAGCSNYEQVLKWAAAPAQSLALDTIARIRQTYPRNRHTKLSELRASSVTGLAGYSLAGEALELLYPQAIFVDAADPRRDHMLEYRRKKSLPIIHPWR